MDVPDYMVQLVEHMCMLPNCRSRPPLHLRLQLQNKYNKKSKLTKHKQSKMQNNTNSRFGDKIKIENQASRTIVIAVENEVMEANLRCPYGTECDFEGLVRLRLLP